jgi:hypothetical protein
VKIMCSMICDNGFKNIEVISFIVNSSALFVKLLLQTSVIL